MALVEVMPAASIAYKVYYVKSFVIVRVGRALVPYALPSAVAPWHGCTRYMCTCGAVCLTVHYAGANGTLHPSIGRGAMAWLDTVPVGRISAASSAVDDMAPQAHDSKWIKHLYAGAIEIALVVRDNN